MVAGCAATRADGTPCRGTALPSGPYCWAHEPALAAKRREVRAKGGRNSATVRRLLKHAPPELQALVDRLLAAAAQVHEGGLDPRRATALAALARAVAALYQQLELAARVERLESMLDGGNPWTSFGD